MGESQGSQNKQVTGRASGRSVYKQSLLGLLLLLLHLQSVNYLVVVNYLVCILRSSHRAWAHTHSPN